MGWVRKKAKVSLNNCTDIYSAKLLQKILSLKVINIAWFNVCQHYGWLQRSNHSVASAPCSDIATDGSWHGSQ